ncbi:MAG: hypothetical protein ACK2VD_20960, partial [Anaerolineae bacterium]
AAPASPSASADVGSSRYTVDTEAEFLNLLEEENAYEAQHNATVIAAPASPSASADLGSSRYTIDADADFLNLLETENAYEERFNPGATAGGIPVASPSSDETSSIDWREHEIDLASGSELNTRADLLSALFGRDWAANAAGEDLSREAN